MDLVRHTLSELKVIPDILRLQAINQPNTIAVIDQGGKLTYQELAERVWDLAAKIALHQPRVVALLIPRSSDYLVAYFAGLSIGATLVPIDPGLTQSEVEWTLRFCEVDLLLYVEKTSGFVEKLNETNSLSTLEYKPQDYICKHALSGNDISNFYPHVFDDVALLLHTSGSLAKPKRVMLTHKGLISNASAHVLHMGLTHEDTVLILLPMHFGYCNTAQILAHMMLGGTLVVLSGTFAPHRCLQLVQEFKITTLTAVPTMLIQMQTFVHRKKYDTTSLKQVSFGGAPFPMERLQQLVLDYPSVAFCQTYGQTEAGPRITGVRPADVNRWPGSIGTPIPGVTVELLKTNGERCIVGEVGEIVVKSPGLMKGYFCAPEETTTVLRDGWLFTGDLGRQGFEGELYIVGRLKNFIIRGGINIYPEEIESVLLQHPAVEAVFVHGLPHDILGEIPHASVVLSKNYQVTQKELRDFASENLASYKLPEIEFVNELPRTYNGKILRKP